MEVSLLPDCHICESEYVQEVERMYRGNKHKILPIAREFAPKFGHPASTMRAWLKKHFENLHPKYRDAQEKIEKEKRVESILESENINFDDYKLIALKKAILQMEEGHIKVRPTDIAALENVGIAKKKLGLEEEAMKLQMAKMYGGFLKDKEKAVEGEVVDESRGVLPETTN